MNCCYFLQGGYGYTIGANLEREAQLLYSHVTDHQVNDSLYPTDNSNNGARFYLQDPQAAGYSRAQMIASSSNCTSHSLNGHMAQAVGYDDPVDLSRGKLMNGLIKEEQITSDRHNVYTGHNGIRVGIPDHNHGMKHFYFAVFSVVIEHTEISKIAED